MYLGDNWGNRKTWSGTSRRGWNQGSMSVFFFANYVNAWGIYWKPKKTLYRKQLNVFFPLCCWKWQYQENTNFPYNWRIDVVVWEKTMDEPQRTTQFPWVPGDRGSRWVDVCTTDSDQGSMSGCCNQWKQYEFRNSGSCTADCLSIIRKDFLKKLMQQHRKNQCFEIWGGAWFAKLVMQKNEMLPSNQAIFNFGNAIMKQVHIIVSSDNRIRHKTSK